MFTFINTNELPLIVITKRIKEMDALAEVMEYTSPELDETQTSIVDMNFYVMVKTQTLEADVIQTLLDDPQTAEETAMLAAYQIAVNGFNNLPNWAGWSQTQAENYITNNIMNGWNQTQIDSWIDTSVTSLAGARTALKQLTVSMLIMRSMLVNIAQAILFLRDLIIRVRR